MLQGEQRTRAFSLRGQLPLKVPGPQQSKLQMTSLQDTMLPEEPDYQMQPEKQVKRTVSQRVFGLNKDLEIAARPRFLATRPSGGGAELREVGYQLEIVEESIGCARRVPRPVGGCKVENSQWSLDTFVEKLDPSGHLLELQKGLRLPQLALEAISRAKEASNAPHIFKGLFQIGNAAYVIVNNRVFLWFYTSSLTPIVHDFEALVLSMTLMQVPQRFNKQTSGQQYKYLLLASTQKGVQFRLLTARHELHRLEVDNSGGGAPPSQYHYERINRRVFVGFEQEEDLQEMIFEDGRPSFLKQMSCRVSEDGMSYRSGSKRRSTMDSILGALKDNLNPKKYDLCSHKFAVDVEKGLLFQFCSKWIRKRAKGPQLYVNVLVDQFLGVYSIRERGFSLRKKIGLQQLKKTMMTINGQDQLRVEELKESPIVGIRAEAGKPHDLQVSFESGQQLQVRVMSSNVSVEIVFHQILPSYTPKLLSQEYELFNKVRIYASSTVALGCLSYSNLKIENENILVIENDISTNSSITGGDLGDASRPLPPTSRYQSSLSVVYRSSNTEERMCLAEVMEEGAVQQVLDFSRLGTLKFNLEALQTMRGALGLRPRFAVLHGEVLKIYSKSIGPDYVVTCLIALDIAYGEELPELCSGLLLDQVYYALKSGLDNYCSYLISILMADSLDSFMQLEGVVAAYQEYLKKGNAVKYISEYYQSKQLSTVKVWASQLLHSLGKNKEDFLRGRLATQFEHHSFYQRLFNEAGGLDSLPLSRANLNSRCFAFLQVFTGIISIHWKRLFFESAPSKLFFNKPDFKILVDNSEIDFSTCMLQRLSTSVAISLLDESSQEKASKIVKEHVFTKELIKMNKGKDYLQEKSILQRREGQLEGLINSSRSTAPNSETKGSQQGIGAFSSIQTDKFKIENDEPLLEGLALLIKRTIQILTLFKNVAGSELVLKNLNPDLKSVLSKTSLKEFVVERIHDLLLKRLILKQVQYTSPEINQMRNNFGGLVSQGELEIFYALKDINLLAQQASDQKDRALPVLGMQGKFQVLKQNVKDLSSIFLADSFKSFVLISGVEEYLELMILRHEYLDSELPKKNSSLRACRKILKEDLLKGQQASQFMNGPQRGPTSASNPKDLNRKGATAFRVPGVVDTFKSQGDDNIKKQIDLLTKQVAEIQSEQETLLINFMSVMIELAGLEEKEKSVYSLPKYLSRYQFVKKMWKKFQPKTKKILVRTNLDELVTRGRKLSFFQTHLIKKDPSKIKAVFLKVLRRSLKSKSRSLRIRMLSWLFGEGRLSLIDDIDAKASNHKLTDDLCALAQREQLITSQNGSESCMFLINNFIKRGRLEIAVSLISRLLSNQFIGEEGRKVIGECEVAIIESFSSKKDTKKAAGESCQRLKLLIKRIGGLKIPSLRQKQEYINKGRGFISNGRIEGLSVEQRKDMITKFDVWEANSQLRSKILEALSNKVFQMSRALEFMEALLKLEDSVLHNADASIYGPRRTNFKVRAYYQARIRSGRICKLQAVLASRIVDCSMVTREELVSLYIKKFGLLETYLSDLLTTSSDLQVVGGGSTYREDQISRQREIQSGLKLLLERQASVSGIAEYLENNTCNWGLDGEMETEERPAISNLLSDQCLTEIMDSPLLGGMLTRLIESRSVYPLNFAQSFGRLLNLRLDLSEPRLEKRMASFENTFQFSVHFEEMLFKIEELNSENGLITFFLDHMEDFCHLDRLGTDMTYFKSTPRAVNMLKMINEAGFDYLWLSNFLKPFLNFNPLFYLRSLEQIQATFVKAVEGQPQAGNLQGGQEVKSGHNRVEMTFRLGITLMRMVKDVIYQIIIELNSKKYSQSQDCLFKHMARHAVQYEMIFKGLEEGDTINEFLLTDERCILLKYLSGQAMRNLGSLLKHFKYSARMHKAVNN